MESPFQVSLILYLDSIECVPRGKKERLNPSIRSGKGAQSSSLRDRLARLQCRSVSIQDASGPHRPPPHRPWHPLALGGGLQEEIGPQGDRPPRKCKMVPLHRGEWGLRYIHPFENVIKLHILPEKYSGIQDFAKNLRGFKDFMEPTHKLLP